MITFPKTSRGGIDKTTAITTKPGRPNRRQQQREYVSVVIISLSDFKILANTVKIDETYYDILFARKLLQI